MPLRPWSTDLVGTDVGHADSCPLRRLVPGLRLKPVAMSAEGSGMPRTLGTGGPASRRPKDVAAWLAGSPRLTELRSAYPEEWERVEREVGALVRGGDPEQIKARIAAAAAPPDPRPGHARPQKVVVAEAVRRQMLLAATRQALLAVETGVAHGTLRLGLVSGLVLQRLLFERDLRRRAVPYTPFRLAWPLLPDRRRLMPLVMEQGIYCFYSRPLLKGLARIIAGRPCVEIAAGDGTLSRLLAERGVQVTATDDHSWERVVSYDRHGVEVQRLDARSALRTLAPEVVLCSWPPPDNTFERHVFTTPSVRTYVLITPRQEVAAGDWNAYRAQRTFDWAEDRRLSRYVLPHTVDGAVYVFRRREGPLRSA